MNEQTAFSFRSAKPKGAETSANKGGPQPESHETVGTLTPVAPPVSPKRRRGRPAKRQEGNAALQAQSPPQSPPLKVDLMHAIRAAAILDETDANAFAKIVAVMNGQNTASRHRIARALVMVFI